MPLTASCSGYKRKLHPVVYGKTEDEHSLVAWCSNSTQHEAGLSSRLPHIICRDENLLPFTEARRDCRYSNIRIALANELESLARLDAVG